ncbi:MAG: adenylosuccinate synthase [Lentisphaeria bacterium]|nr:adenylosuccinate synthase [Lentisphaeria bacterium]
MITAITGGNWGDEGKGKITDSLAVDADFVVRFQGGANAGHTVINPHGKFALHLLPSGVFYPNVTNVIGPGVALDLDVFWDELDELQQRNAPEPQLKVSDRAQVVLPHHRLLDGYEEERLAGASFGSTKRGIAPFYADKALKVGIRVSDLTDPDRMRNQLERALPAKDMLMTGLYGKDRMSIDAIIDSLTTLSTRLIPYICDTTVLLHDAIKAGKNILLEGQLGALRDPEHGIHPFTTSSSTLAGYACVGAGIPPYAIEKVIAVTKAYSSCVGAGPFVTELPGADGDELRERGGDVGEYGATTGRPRRVGWFDAVATKYGVRLQGATDVVLSLVDVLGYLDEIPICTAYDVNGETVTDFPVGRALDVAKPVYETMPGWKSDVSEIREYDELPATARDYVEKVESLIAAPITMISVGPARDALIHRSA